MNLDEKLFKGMNHIVISGYGLAGILENKNDDKYYAYIGDFAKNDTYTTVVNITKEEFENIKFLYKDKINEFYNVSYKAKLFSEKEKHEWKINYIDNHDIVMQGWDIL